MKKLIAPLLLVLTGCGSLPKAGPQAALYDFGISAVPAAATLPVRLDDVRPAPGLEGNDMRYRLAYQNPARVFAYTESRWAAPPDRLLLRRLEQRLQTTGVAQCTLQIMIDAFDQVFDTPAGSRGMVRLRAVLTKGAGRQAVVQVTQVASEKTAASADAQGGAAALEEASEEAVTSVLAWVGGQNCN